MTVASAPAVTPERIQQFAWGYVPPFVIEAAIRNRVFDVLDQGSKNLAQIQIATGASARGLSAIMNALVGLGLLQKDGDGAYALTPESETFLVKGKPGYLGGMIVHTSKQLVRSGCDLTKLSLPESPLLQ
jgi:3-hydroxy-5-methyl-1-naphthoate 3-O-methyltransferase